ncbi:preprotein translocase subunit SecE [Saccharomonospora sp. NPDC046836]|uniref:preprotein translocase subunit SecE n=1 Tax=Saccharomonospora sp. NPDC046836 TaxID=3156921 RepID=UPI0033CF4FB6
MSEDGEKDKERTSKRPSRPVTAAARRERRASARPAGAGTEAESEAGAGTSAEAKKRPAPKGKTSDKAAKPAGKDRPTPKRTRKDTKRGNLFSRFVRFVREVWAELRKVIWPTRKQMVTYTIVVLVFVAFMIALVYVLDFLFLQGVDFVFGS